MCKSIKPSATLLEFTVLHDARISKGGGGFPVHYVPSQLGQEYITHVAAPRRVIVRIELVDENLGGATMGIDVWQVATYPKKLTFAPAALAFHSPE